MECNCCFLKLFSHCCCVKKKKKKKKRHTVCGKNFMLKATVSQLLAGRRREKIKANLSSTDETRRNSV